jgi:hypothetical protein
LEKTIHEGLCSRFPVDLLPDGLLSRDEGIFTKYLNLMVIQMGEESTNIFKDYFDKIIK